MKSEYINCKNCKDDCRCRGKNITPICVSFKPVKTTKADCIRAMPDEKLAELFEMIPHSGNPPTYTIDGFCIDDGLRTKRQWLDWLKSPVEVGNG